LCSRRSGVDDIDDDGDDSGDDVIEDIYPDSHDRRDHSDLCACDHHNYHEKEKDYSSVDRCIMNRCIDVSMLLFSSLLFSS